MKQRNRKRRATRRQSARVLWTSNPVDILAGIVPAVRASPYFKAARAYCDEPADINPDAWRRLQAPATRTNPRGYAVLSLDVDAALWARWRRAQTGDDTLS